VAGNHFHPRADDLARSAYRNLPGWLGAIAAAAIVASGVGRFACAALSESNDAAEALHGTGRVGLFGSWGADLRLPAGIAFLLIVFLDAAPDIRRLKAAV
jgi:hypothetical protein